jgi:hypothetical protein
VAKKESQVHWGDWVLARSRFVGFRRQRDLARDVGCRPEQLSRWLQSPVPPQRMSKGFDHRLALALDSTRRVLFTDYVAIAPDAAPREIALTPQMLPVDWSVPSHMFDAASILAESFLKLLPTEALQVAMYAIQIVLARNDDRRPEFERLQQQLGPASERMATQELAQTRWIAKAIAANFARAGLRVRHEEREGKTLRKSKRKNDARPRVP